MVRTKPTFTVAMVTLLSCWTAVAVSETDTLRAIMTSSEYQETGMHKLSETELQNLYLWVVRRAGENKDPCSVMCAAEQHPQLGSIDRRECHLNANREASLSDTMAAQVAMAVETVKTEIRADYEAAETQTAFTSQVTNNFTGWDNKTVFILDNGQVWRQRHGRPYKHNGDNTVRFEPSLLGMWRMTVISSGRSVAVKRID